MEQQRHGAPWSTATATSAMATATLAMATAQLQRQQWQRHKGAAMAMATAQRSGNGPSIATGIIVHTAISQSASTGLWMIVGQKDVDHGFLAHADHSCSGSGHPIQF
jgi:hypothetical protein